MEIINQSANKFFSEASHYPCVGFVTGPIRIVGAVMQIAINILLLPFTPFVCLAKRDVYPLVNSLRDQYFGLTHLVRGTIEVLPFTSLLLPIYDRWLKPSRSYGCSS